MKRIQENFNIKANKIEPPDIHLGTSLAKMKLESGDCFWNMSPEQYVNRVVTNMEADLVRSGKIFP